MEKYKVVTLSITEKLDNKKRLVDCFLIESDGIKGDVHAGLKNKQISLLGMANNENPSNQVDKQNEFIIDTENITLDQIPSTIEPLDIFSSNDIQLEVSHVNKNKHGSNAAVSPKNNNGILPNELVYCRIIKGGNLKVNDILTYHQKVFDIRILTMSDRAYNGIYSDKSGETLQKMMNDFMLVNKRNCSITKQIIPDEKALLETLLKKYVNEGVDMIFTTGGTGIGPRDITPDVVRPMLDKELNGLMDYIRLKYGAINPKALISRSLAGTIGKSLVYCLPGSENGVKEYITEIQNTLIHSSYMINDLDIH